MPDETPGNFVLWQMLLSWCDQVCLMLFFWQSLLDAAVLPLPLVSDKSCAEFHLQVGCLGITEADWRQLALDALQVGRVVGVMLRGALGGVL